MPLFETISDEIKKAMLAKDKIRLGALRGIKKEFLEAKTAKGASDELSDETAILILQKMVKQRNDSANIFSSQGRNDLAETEIAEADVIRQFLPAQLSESELETQIRQIIAQTGAASIQEMGKVMGIASKQLAGKTDGKAISEMVKKLLA